MLKNNWKTKPTIVPSDTFPICPLRALFTELGTRLFQILSAKPLTLFVKGDVPLVKGGTLSSVGILLKDGGGKGLFVGLVGVDIKSGLGGGGGVGMLLGFIDGVDVKDESGKDEGPWPPG